MHPRNNECCTRCAVFESIRQPKQLEKTETTCRNGLVQISWPRDAIVVEEFGWRAQCAEASLLGCAEKKKSTLIQVPKDLKQPSDVLGTT